jgi:hypothetical protein
MNADGQADTGDHRPGELTPEEARKRRDYHLALYRKYAEAECNADADDVDATDTTMATFILPGD